MRIRGKTNIVHSIENLKQNPHKTLKTLSLWFSYTHNNGVAIWISISLLHLHGQVFPSSGGSFSPSSPPSSAARHTSHSSPPLFHACYLFQVQTLIPNSSSTKMKLIINFIDIVDSECVFFFFWCRNLGQLGCVQSLLPLHSTMAVACLTSHLAVSARACSELSNGTFRRSCQDR